MRRISLRPSQTSRLSRYSTQKRKQSRHHTRLFHQVLVSDIFCLPPPIQIYSSRDLEDNLNKIREICSDDKHDWDQRANAVSRYSSNGIFIWLNIWLFFVSNMFFFLVLPCSLRRSARCWWRGLILMTAFTSTYDSWMEPSNCQLKTCARK